MTLLLSREPFYGLVDPALLRAAARHLCFLEAARPFDLAVVLGAPESHVMPIWEKLVEEGRIARGDQGHWRPTSGMNELAMARFGSPLSRRRADGLVAQLVINAATVNNLPATAKEFYVSRLVVFGSYLDESKDKLGDLDIGWETAERPGTREQMVVSVTGGADPFRRTETLLRPKGPYVRLMHMREVLKLGAPYREIYRFAPPTGPTAGPGSRKRADAGYHGVEKRCNANAVRWHVAMRPGRRRQLDQNDRLDAIYDQIERLKAGIRAKVEHPFRVLRQQFGWFCCSKAVRYDVRNDTNDWKLDEDVESGGDPSSQTPALSARGDTDSRALVRGLSAEPAAPCT